MKGSKTLGACNTMKEVKDFIANNPEFEHLVRYFLGMGGIESPTTKEFVRAHILDKVKVLVKGFNVSILVR